MYKLALQCVYPTGPTLSSEGLRKAGAQEVAGVERQNLSLEFVSWALLFFLVFGYLGINSSNCMLITAFAATVASDIFRKCYSYNFQINKTGDKVDPVDIIYCTFQKALIRPLIKGY